MAPSSHSQQQAPLISRPLASAARTWQETMLSRLPAGTARLVRLRETTPIETWRTTRSSLLEEAERLRIARTALPSDQEARIASFLQSEGQVRARLAHLDDEGDAVKERAEIEAGRPDGCACLGAGGVGMLIAVLEGGLAIFEDYCACADGERAREAATWATEAVQAEEDLERRLVAEASERQRTIRLLESAGIDRRYAGCTFSSFRQLLEARGLMRPAVHEILGTLEESYGTGEPLRGDFIWGDPGHGKSSLSIAMLRVWIERGRRGRFIREGDFLDALHAGMSSRDGAGDALLDDLKTTPLLVFDDVAMMASTAYDRARVVGLLVARHAAAVLTILTSNYSIAEVALRLSDPGDAYERGRLERRVREMCDEWRLVTGQLSTARREDVPVAI